MELEFSKDGKILKNVEGVEGHFDIPDTVTDIIDVAFNDSPNLTSINIPASVTTIDDMAFENCKNLDSITVSIDNPAYSSEDGILYNKDKTTIVLVPARKDLSNFSLPGSVTKIESSAFSYNETLLSIDIPDTVTEIGSFAFSWCSNLRTIKLSSSINVLHTGLFYGCSSLASIDIPSSVKRIEDVVFDSCNSLTSIFIPSTVTELHCDIFSGCTNLKEIHCQVEDFTATKAFSGIDNIEKCTLFISKEEDINYRKNCDDYLEFKSVEFE